MADLPSTAFRSRDEGLLKGEPLINGVCVVAQKFSNGMMKYHPSFAGDYNDQIEFRQPLASGLITIASADTYNPTEAFVGSAEKTFTIEQTSVSHNSVSLAFQNDGGLFYDYLNLHRNGGLHLSSPGTATSFIDSGVQPNTTYTYQLYGGSNATTGQPQVSVSNAITLTTPPNPGTYQLNCYARSATIVDCEILDSLHSANAHRILRNGSVAASTSGLEYADHALAPETTYTYQAEAITWSGIHLGWSNSETVTTPEPWVPEEEPEVPPPPQDPNLPLRVIEGITRLEDNSIINGCNTFRVRGAERWNRNDLHRPVPL